MLLLASDYPFRRIVGVELSPALHRTAQRNVSHYRSEAQRCFDFELRCQDAASYRPPEEDLLIYLFQPFPAATLSSVLSNLREALERAPRRILLAYMNPLFHRQVMDSGTFEVHARGRAAGPGEFDWIVYSNRT